MAIKKSELYSSLWQSCNELRGGMDLVLHSDNGAPMKSYTLKAKMDELKVSPSHSRPRASNDNPFREAIFRTLKYWPQWPQGGFASLEEARR